MTDENKNMFEYLEKYNKLSDDIKKLVTTPEISKIIDDLEKEYNVDLAITVMRVMVKEIKIDELPVHLFADLGLGQDAVEKLTTALKEKVFFNAMSYLMPAPIKAEVETPEIAVEVPEVVVEIPEVAVEAPKAPLEIPVEVPEVAPEILHDEIVPESRLDDYSNKIYETIDKLVEEFKISGNNLIRFKDILKLYLREIRSRIDTRAFFVKDIADGGLGFDHFSVDRILSRADALKNEITAGFKKNDKPSFSILDKINELNKLGADRDASYDLSKLLDVKHEIKGGLDLSHEIAAPDTEVPKMEIAAPNTEVPKMEIAAPAPVPVIAPTPIPASIPAPAQKIILTPTTTTAPVKSQPISLSAVDPNALLGEKKDVPVAKKEITPIKPEVSVVAPKPEVLDKPLATIRTAVEPKNQVPNQPLNQSFSGKIKVEDIKAVKIMSPIDELLYMDLVNFRRLGITVNEIMEKIKNRITNLQIEDYEKGLAALMAWRRSPVNKLYLKIIGTATSEDKTIPMVIEELKNQKQDYLSMDEIEGIIMLNNKLRF